MLSLREDFSGSCGETSSFQKRPILSRGSLEGLQGSLAPSTSLSFPLRSLFLGRLPQGLIYLPDKSSAAPEPYEEYGCRLSKNSPQTASSVPPENLFERQIPSPQSSLRNQYFSQPTRGSGHIISPGPLGLPRWLSGKESACQCASLIPR